MFIVSKELVARTANILMFMGIYKGSKFLWRSLFYMNQEPKLLQYRTIPSPEFERLDIGLRLNVLGHINWPVNHDKFYNLLDSLITGKLFERDIYTLCPWERVTLCHVYFDKIFIKLHARTIQRHTEINRLLETQIPAVHDLEVQPLAWNDVPGGNFTRQFIEQNYFQNNHLLVGASNGVYVPYHISHAIRPWPKAVRQNLNQIVWEYEKLLESRRLTSVRKFDIYLRKQLDQFQMESETGLTQNPGEIDFTDIVQQILSRSSSQLYTQQQLQGIKLEGYIDRDIPENQYDQLQVNTVAQAPVVHVPNTTRLMQELQGTANNGTTPWAAPYTIDPIQGLKKLSITDTLRQSPSFILKDGSLFAYNSISSLHLADELFTSVPSIKQITNMSCKTKARFTQLRKNVKTKRFITRELEKKKQIEVKNANIQNPGATSIRTEKRISIFMGLLIVLLFAVACFFMLKRWITKNGKNSVHE